MPQSTHVGTVKLLLTGHIVLSAVMIVVYGSIKPAFLWVPKNMTATTERETAYLGTVLDAAIPTQRFGLAIGISPKVLTIRLYLTSQTHSNHWLIPPELWKT